MEMTNLVLGLILLDVGWLAIIAVIIINNRKLRKQETRQSIILPSKKGQYVVKLKYPTYWITQLDVYELHIYNNGVIDIVHHHKEKGVDTSEYRNAEAIEVWKCGN